MAEEKTPSSEGSHEPREDGVSYVKEALKWQYNWIGLAGAAAFALISGTGLPLVMAAGLELIYLSLVPQSSRFRRLVRSWQYAEEKRQHEQRLSAMFHELPPELRTRFVDLDKLCRGIRANYARLSFTSQIFVKQLQDQLDGLNQGYLRLLHAAHQHREYLRGTDPEVIKRESAQLQRTLETEPAQVREINRKRIEILKKRLEKFDKVRENRQVIDAQCAAIEDVLELIRDQSVTMRDPQQVSDQLENLVRDVEQTEETVRQVEAIYELSSPDITGSFASLPTGSATSGASTRTRVRN
jgi:hypothetical protein